MRFASVLILLCVSFTFSCRKAPEIISSEFNIVESIMWDHPDYALSLLEKISIPEFSDKLNHATWCLLYTQAWDKKYNKHTSDSLINIAVEYFDSQEDWKRKAQAWFYKGQVLRDIGREDEAVACYVKAKDMLMYFEYPLFASLICQTLGNLYRYQDLYDLSLEVLKEGVRYASAVSEGDDLSYAFSELGRTFAECAEWDSAQYYFERSLEYARVIKDSKAESMAIGELGIVYRSIGDYEKALKYKKEELRIDLQQGNTRNIAQSKYGIGVVFYYMNELDSAKVYFEESLQTSNIYTIQEAYKILYLISKKQEKYKDAITYNEQYRMYNDSIVNIDKTAAIAEIQIKYDNEKLENEQNSLLLKNDQLQRISLGVGVILVFFIGLIAFLYQRKLWLKERHIRETQEEIQGYLSKLYENELAIQESKDLIQSISNELEEKEGLKGLVNDQLEQIDKLQDRIKSLQSQNLDFQQKIEKSIHSVKEYDKWIIKAEELSNQNMLLKNRESFLIDYINKHVSLFKKLPEYSILEIDWIALFESMDVLYHRFYHRLKERFTTLTYEDIQVCCLIKIGLTTSQIAGIFAISSPSITKKKYRIRERMNLQKENLSHDDMKLDIFLKKF